MLTCNSRISATLGFPIKVACWLERSRSNLIAYEPQRIAKAVILHACRRR